MIILGIDPGTAIVGFGIIKKYKNQVSLIDYGCITTASRQPLPARLEDIYLDLTRLIKKYKPSSVAIEEIYFFKNLKTAIEVSHARGVAVLVAQLNKVFCCGYTPLQVKQAVCGYGRADKKQVQQMVKSLLKLKKIPKPDDAADALAVALCHSQSEKCKRLMK